MKKKPARKFTKTIIEVVIISEDGYDPAGLDGVHYDITDGECSGKWNIVSQRTLNPKQAAKELLKQGSDPSFFQLDENGKDQD